MNNIDNQLYYVTRAQEDVLELPRAGLISQREVYGMAEDFATIPRSSPQSRRAENDRTARALFERSFSEIKSKVSQGLHHLEDVAHDFKDNSVRKTESTAEFLRKNPNVNLSLEIVSRAVGTFVSVMDNLNSKMEDVVNRFSRPKWEFKPGYNPYCQRSFDAGNYEYEVMIFRRRLNCMDKLAAKCNVPNVFR